MRPETPTRLARSSPLLASARRFPASGRAIAAFVSVVPAFIGSRRPAIRPLTAGTITVAALRAAGAGRRRAFTKARTVVLPAGSGIAAPIPIAGSVDRRPVAKAAGWSAVAEVATWPFFRPAGWWRRLWPGARRSQFRDRALQLVNASQDFGEGFGGRPANGGAEQFLSQFFGGYPFAIGPAT